MSSTRKETKHQNKYPEKEIPGWESPWKLCANIMNNNKS